LLTATRCRNVPATAWTTPRPKSTADQASNAAGSPVARPSSTAPAQDPWEQCLRQHPDDPEGHSEGERAELLTPDSEQEADW
jgi:hypothetical protein